MVHLKKIKCLVGWSSASFLLKLKNCPNNFFLNLEKNMKISSKTLYINNRDTCISSHIMRKLWFLASKVHNKPVLHVGSHLTLSVIFSCVQLWELQGCVPSISYRNWDQSVCLLILLPNHTAESDLFFFLCIHKIKLEVKLKSFCRWGRGTLAPCWCRVCWLCLLLSGAPLVNEGHWICALFCFQPF